MSEKGFCRLQSRYKIFLSFSSLERCANKHNWGTGNKFEISSYIIVDSVLD